MDQTSNARCLLLDQLSIRYGCHGNYILNAGMVRDAPRTTSLLAPTTRLHSPDAEKAKIDGFLQLVATGLPVHGLCAPPRAQR